MAALAIVIVSFNTSDHLAECLRAIERHAPADTEVIVVDNASTDGSVERVRHEFPTVRLIASDVNLGFGAGNNVGVAAATAPWIMLLNSDAVLLEDTASPLVAHLAAHPDVACVGPRIVLPLSHAIQPKTHGNAPTARRVLMQSLGLSRVFPDVRWLDGIDDEDTAGDRRVDWLSGVCMVMRAADYRAVGGFDPRFFMYCEDIDLCMRLASKGSMLRIDAHAVMHHGGASSRSVAEKVRNAVWQQRHLLTIVRDREGPAAMMLARLFLSAGMAVRLLIGVARIPVRGVRRNELLRSSWSRLHDALFVGATTRT